MQEGGDRTRGWGAIYLSFYSSIYLSIYPHIYLYVYLSSGHLSSYIERAFVWVAGQRGKSNDYKAWGDLFGGRGGPHTRGRGAPSSRQNSVDAEVPGGMLWP